jgi:hypothetical protein
MTPRESRVSLRSFRLCSFLHQAGSYPTRVVPASKGNGRENRHSGGKGRAAGKLTLSPRSTVPVAIGREIPPEGPGAALRVLPGWPLIWPPQGTVELVDSVCFLPRHQMDADEFAKFRRPGPLQMAAVRLLFW